jgi:predicted transcriptional regulator
LPAPLTAKDDLAVGSTCRVCPQSACTARREVSILGGMV